MLCNSINLLPPLIITQILRPWRHHAHIVSRALTRQPPPNIAVFVGAVATRDVDLAVGLDGALDAQDVEAVRPDALGRFLVRACLEGACGVVEFELHHADGVLFVWLVFADHETIGGGGAV